MFCTRCGARPAPSDLFCAHCGNARVNGCGRRVQRRSTASVFDVGRAMQQQPVRSGIKFWRWSTGTQSSPTQRRWPQWVLVLLTTMTCLVLASMMFAVGSGPARAAVDERPGPMQPQSCTAPLGAF